MLNEFPLQSCVNLFRATYGAACAMSLDDKHEHLKQWEYWHNDGAWMDGRLSFTMKLLNGSRVRNTGQLRPSSEPLQFDCTPLEYQLLSWDLSDLVWAAAHMGPQDKVVLPHLSRNLKIFSELKAPSNAFESEFDNVALRFKSWTDKYSQIARPALHQFSPWQALCGRDFAHTDIINHLKLLREHWPLMGESQLAICRQMVLSDRSRLPIFDDQWGKPLPLGSLIMLMGFSPQAQENAVYQDTLRTLPPNDRAVIEKWNICLSIATTADPQTARPRKM